MKNTNEIAKTSKAGTRIYYAPRENAIYTTDGSGRYFVTELIRTNTAEEIMKAVRRWMMM